MAKDRLEGGRGRRRDVVKAGRTRSMGRFYGALAVIGIAGAAVLGYIASRAKDRAVTTVDPNLPPAKAEGYLLGSPNAPVQVLEFADFECPGCGQFSTITEPDIRKRLIETGQMSFRFFDFPLPQHRNSIPASNAAACAADQGKFWEMHDRIFAGQFDWNTQATSRPKGIFAGYAKELGLDEKKWEECFDSGVHIPRITANRAEGERRMVSQTPTFIIGRRQIPGALAYDDFKAYVDSAAAAAPPAATPAAPVTAPAPAPAGGAASPR